MNADERRRILDGLSEMVIGCAFKVANAPLFSAFIGVYLRFDTQR